MHRSGGCRSARRSDRLNARRSRLLRAEREKPSSGLPIQKFLNQTQHNNRGGAKRTKLSEGQNLLRAFLSREFKFIFGRRRNRIELVSPPPSRLVRRAGAKAAAARSRVGVTRGSQSRRATLQASAASAIQPPVGSSLVSRRLAERAPIATRGQPSAAAANIKEKVTNERDEREKKGSHRSQSRR